eukprot:scaffold707_cov399-Prasinococcus_capsulatus_cf.AAC.12
MYLNRSGRGCGGSRRDGGPRSARPSSKASPAPRASRRRGHACAGARRSNRRGRRSRPGSGVLSAFDGPLGQREPGSGEDEPQGGVTACETGGRALV